MTNQFQMKPQAGGTTLVARLVVFGWLVMATGRVFSADTPAGSTQTVDLDYHELPTRIKGWRLAISPRLVPFPKEPELGGNPVGRGIINSTFAGVEPATNSTIPTFNLSFVWDYVRGRLYLDANHNGEFTDDPTYSIEPGSGTKLREGQYFYQTFTNIHLTVNAKAQPHRVLVDLSIYCE